MGQLFIFYTIKRYGPLIFATIQTVRQLLSIVLSILFFAHPLNAMEVLGITPTLTLTLTLTTDLDPNPNPNPDLDPSS